MRKNRKLVALTALVLVSLLICVYAPLIYELHYPQTATVSKQASIGVYEDASLTQNLTAIEWGNVTAGPNTKDIWVKNTGNCPVVLTLRVQDLPTDWAETWDYNNSSLALAEVRQITITLTVPSDTPAGTYSFDMWIGVNT